jgi:hypothetical protein
MVIIFTSHAGGRSGSQASSMRKAAKAFFSTGNCSSSDFIRFGGNVQEYCAKQFRAIPGGHFPAHFPAHFPVYLSGKRPRFYKRRVKTAACPFQRRVTIPHSDKRGYCTDPPELEVFLRGFQRKNPS